MFPALELVGGLFMQPHASLNHVLLTRSGALEGSSWLDFSCLCLYFVVHVNFACESERRPRFGRKWEAHAVRLIRTNLNTTKISVEITFRTVWQWTENTRAGQSRCSFSRPWHTFSQPGQFSPDSSAWQSQCWRRVSHVVWELCLSRRRQQQCRDSCKIVVVSEPHRHRGRLFVRKTTGSIKCLEVTEFVSTSLPILVHVQASREWSTERGERPRGEQIRRCDSLWVHLVNPFGRSTENVHGSRAFVRRSHRQICVHRNVVTAVLLVLSLCLSVLMRKSFARKLPLMQQSTLKSVQIDVTNVGHSRAEPGVGAVQVATFRLLHFATLDHERLCVGIDALNKTDTNDQMRPEGFKDSLTTNKNICWNRHVPSAASAQEPSSKQHHHHYSVWEVPFTGDGNTQCVMIFSVCIISK